MRAVFKLPFRVDDGDVQGVSDALRDLDALPELLGCLLIGDLPRPRGDADLQVVIL